MKQIRLAFVLNDLGIGGVQRIVVDFANRLAETGFAVSVVVLWDRPGADIHRSQLSSAVAFEVIGFKKFWDCKAWFRLYRYIRKERFDIVFTQLFMADLFGRTAALLAGVPAIVTEIQNLIPDFPKKYIWTDRILAHVTDICISTTPAVTAYARDVIGYPARKIIEIPTNAVDERRFQKTLDRAALRLSMGVPADAKLILSVGRLVEQKGHTVLVKAAPAIIAGEPNAYIAIVGDGDLKDALAGEIKELGLEERVKLLGARHDVPDLLRSADVFAFPSIYEGQGMVLFEAMFARVPIVASRTGGIPDAITDGETGLLAPPGDPAALAAAVLRVFQEPDLGGRLVEGALARFGDRTVRRSAEKMKEALERLVV